MPGCNDINFPVGLSAPVDQAYSDAIKRRHISSFLVHLVLFRILCPLLCNSPVPAEREGMASYHLDNSFALLHSAHHFSYREIQDAKSLKGGETR